MYVLRRHIITKYLYVHLDGHLIHPSAQDGVSVGLLVTVSVKVLTVIAVDDTGERLSATRFMASSTAVMCSSYAPY